ncbi:MAG: DUF3108 domain-containing protein [Saprospiraceae bacterium]
MLKYLIILPLLLPFPGDVEKKPPVASHAASMMCDPTNNTFKGGEKLTYKLYYNWNFIWLAAGEVVFKVDDIGTQYKLTAKGRTFSSYEWFFKADDYFESIVDKQTLLPVSFKRTIKENKYRYFEKIEFDRFGNQLRSWTGKTEETAKLTDHPFNGCMRDILAMIYAVRVQDFDSLTTGSSLPINVFLDNKSYDLKLQYLGIKNDKRVHKMGKVKTYQLSPEVIQGEVFKDKDRMNIWASMDLNKIPLLIESPVSVGTIKAVLTDYKGLKYPFAEIDKSDE